MFKAKRIDGFCSGQQICVARSKSVTSKRTEVTLAMTGESILTIK